MNTLILVVLAVLGAIGVLSVLTWAYWKRLVKRCPEPLPECERHTVRCADLWRIALHHLPPANGGGPREPVLLCHGAFANHLNFMAPKGESLAENLAQAGYDVWVLDYRTCRTGAPPFERYWKDIAFEDIVLGDLPAAIDHIRRHTGFGQVHWVGHSMGGMVFYALHALGAADNVASVTALGSPVTFNGIRLRRRRVLRTVVRWTIPVALPLGRMICLWTARLRLRLRLFPVNWRNVHPGVTSPVFFHIFELLPPRVTKALEDWAVTKEWRIQNGQVDVQEALASLRTPLFTVFGVSDPLIPPAEARRFFESLPLQDKQMLMLGKDEGASADYSHVDLAFAKNGAAEVCEPIAEWLRKHPIPAALEQEDEARAADAEEAQAEGAPAAATIQLPIPVALQGPLPLKDATPAEAPPAATEEAPSAGLSQELAEPPLPEAEEAPAEAPPATPVAEPEPETDTEPPTAEAELGETGAGPVEPPLETQPATDPAETLEPYAPESESYEADPVDVDEDSRPTDAPAGAPAPEGAEEAHEPDALERHVRLAAESAAKIFEELAGGPAKQPSGEGRDSKDAKAASAEDSTPLDASENAVDPPETSAEPASNGGEPPKKRRGGAGKSGGKRSKSTKKKRRSS